MPKQKIKVEKTESKHFKFPIRVDLDKEDETRFTAVKDKYKLKNKAEVLRFCVNKVFFGLTLEVDDDIRKEKIAGNKER